MPSARKQEGQHKGAPSAKSPQSSKSGTPVDPASQSPDDPIEFEAETEVARGNEERANSEPEPPALHDAEVPGVPDERGK